jgi:hypothetical protein
MGTLAEDHVDWYLRSIRQLLIDQFDHGYKHGAQDAKTASEAQKGVVEAKSLPKAYQGKDAGP